MEERKKKSRDCLQSKKNVTSQTEPSSHGAILYYTAYITVSSIYTVGARRHYWDSLMNCTGKVNSDFTVMNFLGTFMSLPVTQTQRGERQQGNDNSCMKDQETWEGYDERWERGKGWWTEGKAAEQLLVGMRKGVEGQKDWLKTEERQLTVASLSPTEAEQEALCKRLLVWVSKR